MKNKVSNFILITIFSSPCFADIEINSKNQNTSNQVPNIIKLSSSNIRTFHTGDIITYSSTVAGSGVAMSATLEQSAGVKITNPSGKNCLIHTISTAYTGIGEPTPLNIQLLYYQDEHNSIYECGFYDNEKQSYTFITETENTTDGLAMIFESPMKLGNSTSNLTSFTDGSWKDCTRMVESIEEVTTAVGIYESYKISESCQTNANNSSTNSTIWFVPNIYIIRESGVGDIIAGDFILRDFIFN